MGTCYSKLNIGSLCIGIDSGKDQPPRYRYSLFTESVTRDWVTGHRFVIFN